MADETYNLGRASGILADAVGEPGNRRFRILARNEFDLANLWVERQQLEAMAEAINKLMADYPSIVEDEDPDRPLREGPLSFDIPVSMQFRVGELAIGYDEGHKLFVLLAKDIEAAAGAPPTFSCMVSREQLQGFGYAIHALSASGRQRCPICGRPLDNGPHDHAKSNGHNKDKV